MVPKSAYASAPSGNSPASRPATSSAKRVFPTPAHPRQCDKSMRSQRRFDLDQLGLARPALIQRPEVVEWLRQFPRPVVAGPDGELVEVAEGSTVTEFAEVCAHD